MLADVRPRVLRQSRTREMYIGLRNAARPVRVSPPNQFGDLIVMPDVLHDLAFQIRDRRKDAAHEDVALDLGEPEFDVVQQRRTWAWSATARSDAGRGAAAPPASCG